MKKIIISLGTITVVLIGTIVYLVQHTDKTGPEIIISEVEKEYFDNMSQVDLLSDVVAVDDKDGDVTDSLMIQDIVHIEKDNAVTVIYAAMDHSHNLSVFKRTMSIKRSEEKSTNNQDKVVDVNQIINQPEESEITYPILTLTTNEVTKQVGESFYFGSYVEKVEDDKDDETTLWRRIRLEGNYDMSRVGEYPLDYQVTDSEGNRSEKQTLILKVVTN